MCHRETGGRGGLGGGGGLTAVPWGGGLGGRGRSSPLFFQPLSDSFLFSSLPALPLPSLFPSITSLCASCGRPLQASTCLPAPSLLPPLPSPFFPSPFFPSLTPSSALFPQVPRGNWSFSFRSLLCSLSVSRVPLSASHLRPPLPGGFAHQLFVVQFTLLQKIQDVLLLHRADTRSG